VILRKKLQTSNGNQLSPSNVVAITNIATPSQIQSNNSKEVREARKTIRPITSRLMTTAHERFSPHFQPVEMA
jgi:hypothetical protein